MSLKRRPKSSQKREPAWARYSDEDLLNVRMKDLGVSIKGTWLEGKIAQLHEELAASGVAVRSHFWLSHEWFSPHDTPGIAVPFYLAHPRLAKLERKMVMEVEGGSARECMRILRHEAGHVVQRAYGLHRRRRWQQLFGNASKRYPDHYRPDPTSKRHVQHLRRWYAQCHPDEDFAETFAVWLTPRSSWKKKYTDWPALKKLEYVDELMTELAGVKPPPKRRTEMDPMRELRMTLRDHYAAKRERFAVDAPTIFDRDLKRIFTTEPRQQNAPGASSVIKRHRNRIMTSVAHYTGEYPLALDAALEDVIDRTRALKLRANGSEQRMRNEITALLTKRSVTSLYSAGRRQQFAV